MSSWFNVDKNGLAKLMEGRSKAFILNELVSNAWDEATKTVKVTVGRYPGRPVMSLQVEDDNPDGFKDLSHAYTLFAESSKKSDAEKRGRFNLGEKLVLALATSARIETTTGTVQFDREGRHVSRSRRESGSWIDLTIPATRAEIDEIIDSAKRLIPPPGIATTLNGENIPSRTPITWFEVTLPTLIADSEGVMRRTERKTLVRVYEPLEGEVAMLYEMGIPVVETGDRYHVDVQQKVPLNSDRDNVTPAYLRQIRVAVLNNTFERLKPDETTQTWVREACADENVSAQAIQAAIVARFGDSAVTYDPSDLESNKISTSEGRQIVHGGSLSAGEWANVRRAGLLPPAGQVTPSPKPYTPGGKPLTLIPPAEWTRGMCRIAEFARTVGAEILSSPILVQFAHEKDWPFNATYGPGQLVFNVGRLGSQFFDEGISEAVLDLLIHEFGHHYCGDHLSNAYYESLTLIGAKLTRLAITKPVLFS